MTSLLTPCNLAPGSSPDEMGASRAQHTDWPVSLQGSDAATNPRCFDWRCSMAAAAVLHLPVRCVQDIPDLKTKIMRAATSALESTVDAIMKDIKGKDLQALSEALLEKGQTITGAVLSTLLNGLAEDGQPSAPCPQCGKSCPVHSNAGRQLTTRHGDISFERPYFYCSPCGLGFAPFDEKMKVAPQKKQYDLQAGAAELLTEVPFDVAARLFKRLTGQAITDHTLHELGSRLGETARTEDVLPSKKKVEAIIEEHSTGRGWRPVLVVSADGAHAPTRPETGKRSAGTWQEAKGFRIYLVGQDRIEQVMSWHQIANEEEFGQALRFAATLIPQDTVRIALIGDGAKWIWSHLCAAFPDGKEILDYYHCSEHIHKLAELHYPKETERQALWIESTMARLYFGDVESVIWGLQRMKAPSEPAGDAIEGLIGYLRNNAHRIDYKKTKRGQYPLGSGGIESANKFICHVRIKRSGAWWYKINGNRILSLRCAAYNDTFDQVFARYKRLQVRGAIKPPRTSRNA